jgi:hypothetical protein
MQKIDFSNLGCFFLAMKWLNMNNPQCNWG